MLLLLQCNESVFLHGFPSLEGTFVYSVTYKQRKSTCQSTVSIKGLEFIFYELGKVAIASNAYVAELRHVIGAKLSQPAAYIRLIYGGVPYCLAGIAS